MKQRKQSTGAGKGSNLALTQSKEALKELASLSPEQARAQFRTLLVANPNFFGNLKASQFKAILPIAGNTNYEEIACVGYHPQLQRLEAIVYLTQSAGYNGGLCSNGSQEYVRFYLSSDGGATWQDQGMSSFTAYDVQNPGRLEYAVTLPIDPTKFLCVIENLPKVRAILSWNNPPPPNTPGFIPVWGNVVDVNIQVRSASLLVLGKLFETAKVKLADSLKNALDLNQEISAAEPKALTSLQLHELYKKEVPPHRYLFSDLKTVAVNPALTQANLGSVVSTPLAKLNIDLASVISVLFNTDGDTSYEQLDCIGYDPNREALAGVLTVKKSGGYSGGLCTAGSHEYVAFWVDWGDGTGWNYAGTASVNTHDIKAIPAGGLKYSVFLPIDVAARRQVCLLGPRIPKVRAILSWQTSPPPGNPDYRPTWGNRLETRILLSPGATVPQGLANISIIGGIGLADINVFGNGLTRPGALFALTGSAADPWLNTRECPFGGLVTIQGYPSVGDQYRIRVYDTSTGTDVVLKDKFQVVDLFGNRSMRTPDPATGYLTYIPVASNMDNVLGYWNSGGNDRWLVRLEILHPDNTTGATPWYNIQLYNARIPAGVTTSPGIDIHIDSGGDCKDVNAGGTVQGHFFALYPYFGAFGVSTEPNTAAFPSNAPATATASTTSTAAWPGDQWSLSTTAPAAMKPCGYVVRLDAWDRTIVGSSPNSHHSNSIAVGFCLRAG